MFFKRKKCAEKKSLKYITDEEKKRLHAKAHQAVEKLPPLSTETINELKDITNDVFFYGDVKNDAEMKIRSHALYESMQGNYQKAVDICDLGLEINPSSAYLLHMRGRSYADMGRVDEATKDLESVLKIMPDSAETLYEMANMLFNTSMYDDALCYARKAAEIEPDSYLHCAIDMEGVVAAQMEKWDEAIKLFDRALEIKPGYVHALLTKAHVLGNKGNALKNGGKYADIVECHRGMLACYKEILQSDPRNFIAAIEMGVVLHILGIYDEAIEHFRGVLELDAEGDYEIANMALAYMADNSYDKILTLLDTALGGNPEGTRGMVCRGILLEMLDRYGDALWWYTEALKSCSKDVFLLLRTSNVLIMLRDGAKAIKYLNRVLKMESSNNTAISMKGSALSVQGKHEEAVRYYDLALDINPHDTITLHNKGRDMAIMGYHGDAVKQYKNALEKNPRDAYTLHDLGVSLVELKRFDEAIESYNKSLSLNPRHTITIINVGLTLELLGRHQDAIVYFDRALEVDPNSEIAIYHKRRIHEYIHEH